MQPSGNTPTGSRGAGSDAGDPGNWKGSIPPPDDEDNLVGDTLSDTYKVLRVLGEGGMGRVYEAQHTRINSKRFALKALHPEFARRKDVLARFQREVEAAASINSQHVVGVYDVDQTEDGRPFLVSELLQGQELGDYLDDNDRIPVGFAVCIVRQMCRALIAAHAEGVVHRDMKPENVFLSGDVRDPVVKVLDFGISRLEGQQGNTLTKTGFIMGTPSYMSPEQAMGQRVDHRADIYSTGAILYQCVTGRIPFDRADATATLAAVLTEEPERPRAIAPDLPEHIEMIIQTAMARAPEDRYQSMVEFDAALAPYDESAAITADASQSLHIDIRQTSLVDASEQAREVRDARPQLVVFGGLTVLSLLFALSSAVSGGMRFARGGTLPTISGTEALVMGLILVAALSTPIGLLIRHIKKNIWGNTAKVLEIVRAMREALIVGLGAYGLLAITVRMLETVLLRTQIGIAWPWWDLMLPLVGAVAGLVVFGARRGAKGSVSFIDRLGRTTSVSISATLVLTVVIGASVMREDAALSINATAPNGNDSSETGTDRDPEAAADGSDGETAEATPDSTSIPLGSKDAFKQWDKVLHNMKVGNIKGAVSDLALLIEIDQNAPKDPNVRKGIANLAIKACLLNNATCDQMIELLTGRMGKRGVDLLYEVYTTRGGTQMWKHADRLLRDPATRKKGTVGMNIAYELRAAKGCDAKKALFARVRKEGDFRALRELEILKSRRQCRAVRCCLNNDADLNDTVRTLLEKQP